MTVPSFGVRVRAWREHLGQKQQDVAARAGLKAARLCRIEKGKRSALVDESDALARALGITIVDLAGMPPPRGDLEERTTERFAPLDRSASELRVELDPLEETSGGEAA